MGVGLPVFVCLLFLFLGSGNVNCRVSPALEHSLNSFINVNNSSLLLV